MRGVTTCTRYGPTSATIIVEGESYAFYSCGVCAQYQMWFFVLVYTLGCVAYGNTVWYNCYEYDNFRCGVLYHNNIMGERAEVSIWHFLLVKISSREIIVVSWATPPIRGKEGPGDRAYELFRWQDLITSNQRFNLLRMLYHIPSSCMISIMVHMPQLWWWSLLTSKVTDFDALITEISLTAQYSFQCSDQSGRGQLAMSTG